jgi:hypothetical protein
VSFDDWALALHVLSAFAYVGGIVLFCDPHVARHRLRPRGRAGGLILLVSLVAGGVGVRRLQAGKGTGLLTATLVLSVVLLGAYVVAVWAMAGKPN